MTATTETPAPSPAVTCPSWCAYGPHDDSDPLHMSESREVTPASTDHVCERTVAPAPYGTETCADPVCAQLIAHDGEPVLITLNHNDTVLPELTPAGAAELGGILIALAFRAAVPSLTPASAAELAGELTEHAFPAGSQAT